VWAGTSHLLLLQWGGEEDTSHPPYPGLQLPGLEASVQTAQLEALKEAAIRKARGSPSKG